MRALLLSCVLLGSCIDASTTTTTSAFVDEIEDDDARIILDGDIDHVYTIPRDILPEEVREGATVRIIIEASR